ncbi:MAG: hypothetical protein ACLTSX_12895 [Collinsella sp.]
MIDMEMEATVGDELRWFSRSGLARCGRGPSDPVYLGSIGKLVDIDDRQAELIDPQFKAYHDPLTEVVSGAFARSGHRRALGLRGGDATVIATAMCWRCATWISSSRPTTPTATSLAIAC